MTAKDIADARWGPAFRQRKRFATSVLKNLGMKVGTGSIEEKIREEASCLRNRVSEMTEYEETPFDVSKDLNVSVANVIRGMLFGERHGHEDTAFREFLDANTKISAEFGSA
ncbi:cytochrome P450 2 sub U member 1 [Branchiostoma belcheri]|nr:cytochrome P450 2 sub U member 1 [Branchiostoma belcheri]